MAMAALRDLGHQEVAASKGCLAWSGAWLASYENCLLWALAKGFLRLGEVFPPARNCIPPLLSDLGTDSQPEPSYFLLIGRAKNDPFGKGSFVFLGKTNKDIFPTQEVKGHFSTCTPGNGALFLRPNSSLCSRDHFVYAVYQPCPEICRTIGAATTAAAAGLPAHTIKRLGRCSLDAYMLYVRKSDSSLCDICAILAPSSNC